MMQVTYPYSINILSSSSSSETFLLKNQQLILFLMCSNFDCSRIHFTIYCQYNGKCTESSQYSNKLYEIFSLMSFSLFWNTEIYRFLEHEHSTFNWWYESKNLLICFLLKRTNGEWSSRNNDLSIILCNEPYILLNNHAGVLKLANQKLICGNS